jgi:hypothetical protein
MVFEIYNNFLYNIVANMVEINISTMKRFYPKLIFYIKILYKHAMEMFSLLDIQVKWVESSLALWKRVLKIISSF